MIYAQRESIQKSLYEMVEKYGPQVYGEEFEAKRILKNGMFDWGIDNHELGYPMINRKRSFLNLPVDLSPVNF